MQPTYYIHGFNSSVNSSTFRMLSEKIEGIIPLTYDHDDPMGSVMSMVDQVASQPDHPIIIASSLGGWYAEQIARYVPTDLVLYNPSLNPCDSLEKYGVDSEVRSQYKSINADTMAHCLRTVVLSVDDDVVPYDNALNIYYGRCSIHETSGGHRMTEENLDIVVDAHNYLSNLYSD